MTQQTQPPIECEQVQDWLFGQIDDVVGINSLSAPHEHLVTHLSVCGECQSYQTEMRNLVDSLRGLPTMPAPEGLADRVMARVDAVAFKMAETEDPKVGKVVSLSSRRKSLVRWVPAGVIAAAVAAILLANNPLMPSPFNQPDSAHLTANAPKSTQGALSSNAAQSRTNALTPDSASEGAPNDTTSGELAPTILEPDEMIATAPDTGGSVATQSQGGPVGSGYPASRGEYGPAFDGTGQSGLVILPQDELAQAFLADPLPPPVSDDPQYYDPIDDLIGF